MAMNLNVRWKALPKRYAEGECVQIVGDTGGPRALRFNMSAASAQQLMDQLADRLDEIERNQLRH